MTDDEKIAQAMREWAEQWDRWEEEDRRRNPWIPEDRSPLDPEIYSDPRFV